MYHVGWVLRVEAEFFTAIILRGIIKDNFPQNKITEDIRFLAITDFTKSFIAWGGF